MNYIKQLNEFYTTLDYNPLSVNAIAVYFILLQIANKTGWLDEFKVANTVLMSKCNLDKQSMERARKELISKKYIGYQKGKNQNVAPTYHINILYTLYDTPDNMAGDTAEDTPNDTPDNTINKQKKTKRKETKQKVYARQVERVGKPLDWETQFEQFWKQYPRKRSKQRARDWFEKNKPNSELFSLMLTQLEQFKGTEEWRKDHGQFIPYPTTWLNQKRWEDEITAEDMSSTRNTDVEADELIRQYKEEENNENIEK